MLTDNWIIGRTEYADPGYRWFAHHPDNGEHYFRTKREAVSFAKTLPDATLGARVAPTAASCGSGGANQMTNPKIPRLRRSLQAHMSDLDAEIALVESEIASTTNEAAIAAADALVEIDRKANELINRLRLLRSERLSTARIS